VVNVGSLKRMVRVMLLTHRFSIDDRGKSESYARTVKSKTIQKMLKDIHDKFSIEFVKLVNDVYVSKTRHSITKVRRLVTYLVSNYPFIEVYIYRKVGIRDVSQIFLEEHDKYGDVREIVGIKELSKYLLNEAKKHERAWKKATSYEWWNRLVTLLEILSK